MRLWVVPVIVFSATAMAEEGTAPPGAGLPPPPIAAPSQPDGQSAPPENTGAQEQVTEPQVTIVQRGEDRFEEYRMAGRLYMIKVIPAKGFPYYLIDTTGNGSLDTRTNQLTNPIVPQWVLLRW